MNVRFVVASLYIHVAGKNAGIVNCVPASGVFATVAFGVKNRRDTVQPAPP
jgi:hypothetical protein